MAGDGQPMERLRVFLRGLPPGARAMLVAELERALLRGDDMPAAEFILDELRRDARKAGHKLPRPGNASRLFFVPLEPFLVDDAPERKHRGRISRGSLAEIWQWISRDLMPVEAKAYSEQVNLLIAAKEQNGAEQLARAFQDRALQRLQDTLAAVASDDKARRRLTAQIAVPQALEVVRDIHAILKVRDALAVVGSRLSATITNLADDQLENVKALLDSPLARHRDIFLYALLMVLSRLAVPWQLIRLAIKAAESDIAARIAETPFAVAVDIVLTDIERMVEDLAAALKGGRSENVAAGLKDIHDAVRALRTEMDLSGDSSWARQLAAIRAEVSELLTTEIENAPGQVRRLLRQRKASEIAPDSALDPIDVAEAEGAVSLVGTCRNYASELALSEVTLRAHSDLQNFLDNGTSILLDTLRVASPRERKFRQSQVDAAVRFCARHFGAEYAALLAKAAEVAVKEEPKLAKA
jgi:truncated hemoglobin YjbI